MVCHAAHVQQPPALRWVADKRCTPGEHFKGVTVKQVCRPGWASSHRHVTLTDKREVFADYGLFWQPGLDFETDHLIPLELGGDNSHANLWPEPRGDGSPGDALDKDQTENALHTAVCARRITLRVAWKIMRTWTR